MTEGQVNVVKAGSAWSFVGVGEMLQHVGINNWAEAASAAAFVLSVLFIIDWFNKRFKREEKERRDEDARK